MYIVFYYFHKLERKEEPKKLKNIFCILNIYSIERLLIYTMFKFKPIQLFYKCFKIHYIFKIKKNSIQKYFVSISLHRLLSYKVKIINILN